MKKTITSSIIGFLALMPALASAHEHQEFEINGVHYSIVVGSMNEPVTVDDSSGVELEITREAGTMMHDEEEAGHEHTSAGGVTGLEDSLKVELIAGDKKKVLDLSPTWGVPGGYYAKFYPTVATTLSYRIFGDISGTPFDYTFSCNPAGHAPAPEDTTRVEVSDKVFRIHKSGSYGCPVEKASMGFPEESADIVSLKQGAQSGMLAWGAIAISLLALAMSFRRRS